MTTPEDTPRRIAAALERIERLTRSGGRRAASALALSPLQMRVLGALNSRDSARMGELARELLVTDGTVSEAVRVLEEKGLVLRGSDPDEHRAVQVRLTRKGKGASQRANRWPDDLLGPVLDEMGQKDAGQLLSSLLRFLQTLERRGLIETSRMCANCDHFRPWKGKGGRPHYCALLETSSGKLELQVDCPDFVPAEGARLAERWELLRDPD